jgi:hypothetical protein
MPLYGNRKLLLPSWHVHDIAMKAGLMTRGLLVLALGSVGVHAQNLVITSIAVTNGSVQIGFPGSVDSYFLLEATPSLNAPLSPVSAMLGANASQTFQQVSGGSASMFFRIQKAPLTSLNDMDGDGLPDVWELQHGLNPLDPTDAPRISTDGVHTWLQLYQAYLNTLPLNAWFTAPESAILSYTGATNLPAPLNVPVRFTRAVTGAYSYNISGPAVANVDYAPLSGQIQVNNSATALIPLQPLTSSSLRGPRSVVLTLKRPGTNAPAAVLATPAGNGVDQFASQVITIRDADQGLYSGNLSFLSQTTRTVAGGQTNVTIIPAPAIAPSTLLMALRSGSPNGVAVLEFPECVLFGNNRLVIPVSLTGNYSGFTSTATISGTTLLSQLANRSVYWTLQLANVSFTNQGQGFAADCVITVNGLSASGRSLVLNGSISATRIDP